MASLLSKIIVSRYYQVNLGFFLLMFLLLFGIVNGHDAIQLHTAVMTRMMESFLFQGIAMVVWALYNFKCISFTLKELNRPENNFLYLLQALPDGHQFALLLQCQAAVYFPVLLYGGIAAGIGIAAGHFLMAGIFVLFQLGMCVAGAAIYFHSINSTWKRPAISMPAIVLFRKRRFNFWLLHFSLHQRKGTFIGIKLFSLLLLQIMVAANSGHQSREAVCVLIMFLISAHCMLALHYVGFTETELRFIRNLPLGVMRRFGVYIITYAVIFVPELLFLLCNERTTLPLQIILSLYALAVSQLSLYTAILHIRGLTTERYTSVVFVIFFVTLLLLASFSLWFVFAGEAVIATVMFRQLYWGYEAVVKEEEKQ